MNKLLATLTASALAVGLLVPGTLSAQWQRYSIFACSLDGATKTLQGAANHSPNLAYATCALDDTDRFPKEAIQRVNVHVFDGNVSASVEARLCYTTFQIPGGNCGASAVSGYYDVGDETIYPAVPNWNASPGAFGWLSVVLPPPNPYSSAVRGFFAAAS